MPAVVWCALGAVAGDVAGLLLSGTGWLLGPGLALGGVLAWRREARGAVVLTAAAAGVVWGAAAAGRAAHDCRSRWREGERVAVVVGLWDVAARGGASRATVWWPEQCAGRLTVAWPSWIEPPGAAAVILGTWHRGARAGSPWPARPERSGRLVARHVRPLAHSPGLRAGLRLAAEQRMARLFGPTRAPLAAALTVGTGDLLDADVRQRFAHAGLAHILAISGLHVGILAAALLLVLRAARVGDAAARLAGTALVAGYVGLLGWPPPAVRAVGLIALWCWARVRQRPLVPFAPLAATALGVIALDPFAVTEPGPWLSFAGAWGCVTAARAWAVLRHERSLPRNRHVTRLLSVAAVSGGATLATAPISILAFGTMAPAALVSNVLAVPLAGFVVPSLALTLALAGLLPAAAPLAAGAAAVGLDALDGIARLAGALPLASVPFERTLLAALVLAAVGAVLLRPYPRAGKRSALRALRGRGALALALACCAAVWWPLVPGGAPGYRSGRLALHFLAVGEGDAAAIVTPAGRWILVDGGPRAPGYDAGASVVAPFLRRNGVRRIAVAVASHGDADHLGGMPTVVRTFRPELVLEPGQPLAREGYRRFLAAAAEAGSRWRPARAGDRIVLDGVTLRVWHPDSAWLERQRPTNENSVVLTVEYGGFRAVLPGDGGLAMEAAPGIAGRIPAATVLKVAHHGSRSATSPAWLAAVAPRVCIISVGPNGYGEPDPGVVAALVRAGCTVFRTDVAGTVTVETEGRTVRVHAGQRDTTFTLTREQP
jgi:competence protein ComEC